jgi:hypothetical protein
MVLSIQKNALNQSQILQAALSTVTASVLMGQSYCHVMCWAICPMNA